jgi:hypothetical protein
VIAWVFAPASHFYPSLILRARVGAYHYSVSVEPYRVEPTTVEPTTVEPTTVVPTTVEPKILEPTTMEPTTVEPTTVEPTTVKPTRVEPTTVESLKELHSKGGLLVLPANIRLGYGKHSSLLQYA